MLYLFTSGEVERGDPATDPEIEVGPTDLDWWDHMDGDLRVAVMAPPHHVRLGTFFVVTLGKYPNGDPILQLKVVFD